MPVEKVLKQDPTKQEQDAMRLAFERLHHLSMRYAGALIELLGDKPVGLIRQGHPGFREARDFIDLILITRAEINGLTKLLTDAGVFSVAQFTRECAEQYEWLTQQKAKFLKVEVDDAGLVFKSPGQG